LSTYYSFCLWIVLPIFFATSSPATATEVFDVRVDQYEVCCEPSSIICGDLDGNSYTDLAVANHGSDNIAVLLGNDMGGFEGAMYFDAGNNPSSIVLGDFNADGIKDLATANQGSSDISILLGNGDGSLHDSINYYTGFDPHIIITENLDGDNVLDIVVGHKNYSHISVLRGNGDGTFDTFVNYNIAAPPSSIAIGHLDGDNNFDLAVLCGDSGHSHVDINILLGDGQGAFYLDDTFNSGSYPRSIVVADLNCDGNADIATANGVSPTSPYDGYVTIFLSNGNGTFQSALYYPSNIYPDTMTSGDFNSDERLDLIISNSSMFLVLLGKDDGSFRSSASYCHPEVASMERIAIGDFNGDTLVDLAHTGSNSSTVSVVHGKGDGSFTYGNCIGFGGVSIAVDDFDQDGYSDVVALDHSMYDLENIVSIRLGNGDMSFGPRRNILLGQYAYLFLNQATALDVNDFDNDGYPDIVVQALTEDGDEDDSNVVVLLGNGDGTFRIVEHIYVFDALMRPPIGDLNNDGNQDLIVEGCGQYSHILFGNGDGTFHESGLWPPIPCTAESIEVVDINGDDILDFVVACGYFWWSSFDGVATAIGNGDGTFQDIIRFEDDSPASLATCDFDDDNDIDVAVANISGYLSIWLNFGDGSFQPRMQYWVGDPARTIVCGMINGDDYADLAVASNNGDFISILYGYGDGTFQAPIDLRANVSSFSYPCDERHIEDAPSFLLCDLDNDGDSDILTSRGYVLRNNTYSNTIRSELSCVPTSGGLPFTSSLTIRISNLSNNHIRKMAGRLDLTLADGNKYPSWRTGFTNINPDASYISTWPQYIPALSSLIGVNTFTLFGVDVTPPPYNHPPYPPSGFTATDSCIVVGF